MAGGTHPLSDARYLNVWRAAVRLQSELGLVNFNCKLFIWIRIGSRHPDNRKSWKMGHFDTLGHFDN